ncbi:uncharacterized protein RHOBADRAFT_53660, partial [Rhodotorula graminis WP1]
PAASHDHRACRRAPRRLPVHGGRLPALPDVRRRPEPALRRLVLARPTASSASSRPRLLARVHLDLDKALCALVPDGRGRSVPQRAGGRRRRVGLVGARQRRVVLGRLPRLWHLAERARGALPRPSARAVVVDAVAAARRPPAAVAPAVGPRGPHLARRARRQARPHDAATSRSCACRPQVPAHGRPGRQAVAAAAAVARPGCRLPHVDRRGGERGRHAVHLQAVVPSPTSRVRAVGPVGLVGPVPPRRAHQAAPPPDPRALLPPHGDEQLYPPTQHLRLPPCLDRPAPQHPRLDLVRVVRHAPGRHARDVLGGRLLGVRQPALLALGARWPAVPPRGPQAHHQGARAPQPQQEGAGGSGGGAAATAGDSAELGAVPVLARRASRPSPYPLCLDLAASFSSALESLSFSLY